MYWKAGNTGFLILSKRILAVRALLNNQKKKIEQEKTSARRGGFLICPLLSRTAVGIQSTKLCGSLVDAPFGGRGEEKSSLITILRYPITSNIQIRQQDHRASVLLAHCFPQPLHGFRRISRSILPVEIVAGKNQFARALSRPCFRRWLGRRRAQSLPFSRQCRSSGAPVGIR